MMILAKIANDAVDDLLQAVSPKRKEILYEFFLHVT